MIGTASKVNIDAIENREHAYIGMLAEMMGRNCKKEPFF